LLARQGTEPRQARLAAGALGAAAGAVGAFLVDLWCPVGHPFHLFLGHLLPMGSLTALGMILGWRLVVLR
ncbi:MAG TPA: NrsF family protein, partial [Myxococcota bacterium]|nr:NrsF family protein [Myxococcota bacterium]